MAINDQIMVIINEQPYKWMFQTQYVLDPVLQRTTIKQ